jgi:uncharacterized protein
MKTPIFDSEHLDIATFSKASAELAGQWPLNELERLCSSTAEVTSAHAVTWQLQGKIRPIRGGDQEIWLTIKAQTTVSMVCQRCLQAVPIQLDVNRDFQFVFGEDAAVELDANSEHDVLAMSRSFNAQVLVEDELLLALPLIPMHEHCPEPLQTKADAAAQSPDLHPFAALAQLKSGAQGA